MIINLQEITKQYSSQTIIKKLSYRFESGKSYAIFGHNGAGKSTLLQLIAGSISPNKGKIIYEFEQKVIAVEDMYQHISLAAPYMDLIEDMSMDEMISFHFKFKKSVVVDPFTIMSSLLQYDKDKLIRNYSSGMKQRLKLLMALFTESKVLLLDEPTANFDNEGIEWYRDLIQKYRNNRTLIIASAQNHDHDFCAERITM
jgi:ABC-type multidrug transport system ATPase subunit